MARVQQTAVFAYGTLRPGCGNDSMLGNYRHVGAAVVGGTLAYHSCGGYPVYIEGCETTVYGDILLADDRLVAEVVSMEVFAGYDVAWQDITADNNETWECLTFPWRRPQHGRVIDSGDWTQERNAWQPPRNNPRGRE